jgi:hypothetical protein
MALHSIYYTNTIQMNFTTLPNETSKPPNKFVYRIRRLCRRLKQANHQTTVEEITKGPAVVSALK